MKKQRNSKDTTTQQNNPLPKFVVLSARHFQQPTPDKFSAEDARTGRGGEVTAEKQREDNRDTIEKQQRSNTEASTKHQISNNEATTKQQRNHKQATTKQQRSNNATNESVAQIRYV